MLQINNIDTINKGYEEIASLQLSIAKDPVSGDVTIFNKKQMLSTKLYAFITAITEVPFNHNPADNLVVARITALN
jgi:hypothetical protein